MSFDYNVFKHVELVVTDDDPNLWFWHCHGCGADGDRKGQKLPLEKADELVASFHAHVRKSHACTPEDMAEWSKW